MHVMCWACREVSYEMREMQRLASLIGDFTCWQDEGRPTPAPSQAQNKTNHKWRERALLRS
jgi:hypothetical protein